MSVSCAALLAASALPLPASAGNYDAANEAELRQAITDANADGDASATITLTDNVAVTDPTAFPALTKPVTIATGAFTLSGVDSAGAGNGGSLSFLGGPLFVTGAVRGGNVLGTTSTGAGGIGLLLANGSVDNSGTVTGGAGGNNQGVGPAAASGAGGVGMSLTASTLINRNAITGGAGGNVDVQSLAGGGTTTVSGNAGIGLLMSGGLLDNRGAITGGAGGNIVNIAAGGGDNMAGGAGGVGASLTGGTGTHVNSSTGTITGGMGGIGTNAGGSTHGVGGGGLSLAGGASFLNNGTIIGANGRAGGGTTAGSGSAGGFGVTVTSSTFENTGTVQGGHAGATAANSQGTGILGSNATVINSGTITAGALSLGSGTRGNAINFTAGTNRLELRSGSAITGNVLANGTSDTLALGGTANSSFNVAEIGGAAQYRNFEAYQKVGTSTWTLTGTTATVTAWQLLDGTLSVSSNTNLGGAAGSLTFNGGILQVTGTSFTSTARTINWGVNGGGFDIADPANTFTVAQSLTGGGPLAKLGAGRLVLTGTNTYASTIIDAGTLQLGNGGATGSITGDVLNNGTLAFNRSNSYTLGGVISGTGAVNQIGAGTTVLTGDNTYTGLTTISAGRLELGDGGTSGSIVGNILNNSILAFNRSDTFEVPGAISGSGAVEQNGTGTTVLTGNNIYTGGTTINTGTLRLGNGGTTGSIVGDVLNNSTLEFNRSNTMTFGGDISGSGAVNQIGGGVTVLTGANIYTGDTTISAGTLRAGAANVFSPLSTNSVLAGGTLDLNGFDQTLVSLNNAGLVQLNGAPGTTLTVTGDYTGSGGIVHLNTALNDDLSSTDRLVVQGNTSGASALRVTNVGGAGAQTVEGIKIVDVVGASNGTFSLLGDYVFQGQQAVVGGAYAYTLQKNGVSTPADGDWYLRSSLINTAVAGPLYQPGVPLYENYAQVLLGLNAMPTLQHRVGNRYWTENSARMSFAAEGDAPSESAFWGRTEGAHTRLQSQTTTGSTYSADQVKLQAGLDGLFLQTERGQLIGGATVQHGTALAKIGSSYGDGKIRTTAFSFGGTLTWYDVLGFYVDGQAQLSIFNSTLHSELASRDLVRGNDGQGRALSIEVGKRFGFGPSWTITPQAQLVYSSVDFDRFTDTFGALVSLDRGESLKGRLGLAAEYNTVRTDESGRLARVNVYSLANLYYEFLDGTLVDVAETKFANANERLWGGIGAGGSYNWANDKYALFGEVLLNTGLDKFGDSYSVGGTIGFRARW